MHDIVPTLDEGAIELVRLAQSAAGYARQSLAPNTIKSYEVQWRQFREWCEVFDLIELPATPETIATYLAFLADNKKSYSTIQVTLSAIKKAHTSKGLADPRNNELVRQTLRGIARDKGTRPRQVEALAPDNLREIFDSFPTSPSWQIRRVRNKALLLIGFAAALRRSEIADLVNSDIQFVPEGVRVLIRKSKSDQTGIGIFKAVPYGQYAETCPVKSLKAWISYVCPCEGTGGPNAPLFPTISYDGMTVLLDYTMCDRSIALLIKAACARAGITGRYSGHSLRAGLVTTAARANKPLHSIMDQTGHSSVQMVLRYIREQQKFANNAANNIGL